MRQSCVVLVLALAAASLPSAAIAQDPGVAIVVERDGRPLDPGDARRVREELRRLLAQHPPNLRTVLQADPSLLNRPDYLAPYPRVADFIKQHPEVARDPGYFLGRPDAWTPFPENETQAERESRRAYDTLQAVLAGLAVLIGLLAVVLTLAALVRAALAHRRWSRQSRVQTEVHTKILDRLQSNEEVLAYIQTPAGQRFLQTGPSPLPDAEPPRAIGAPYSRIFWSVQIGIVLLALGIGLGRVASRVPSEIAGAFNAMGIIASALGVGAIVSGVVSYALSSRFGLLQRRTD
jgi:hypothetical protein